MFLHKVVYIDMLIYLVQVKPASSKYVLNNVIKKEILFCPVRSSYTILICKSCLLFSWLLLNPKQSIAAFVLLRLYTGLSGWGRRGFADPFSPGGLLNETGRDASHLAAKIADLGPEFQVTGMIEWGQKLKPNKIPRASKKPPQKSLDQNLTLKKSHAEFPSHKNFQRNYVARICGNYHES